MLYLINKIYSHGKLLSCRRAYTYTIHYINHGSYRYSINNSIKILENENTRFYFCNAKGKVYKNYDDKPGLDIVVDGGIIGNFPIDIFDEIVIDSLGHKSRIPNPKTLGIRMNSDQQIEQDKNNNGLAAANISNLKTYLIAFFILTVESVNRSTLTPTDWDRTISVSSVGVSPKIKKLKNEEIERLVASGEQAVINYFKNK